MSFPWIEAVGIAVSVGSAMTAAVQARRARESEREVQRLRFLEDRVSAHKHDTYEPIIETLGDLVDGIFDGVETPRQIKKFSRWISIYGSDEAIIAFRNMMTTNYQMNLERGTHVPGALLFRMYMEFVLAARRDMGDPETKILPLDLLAPIIKDAYDNVTLYEDLTLPLADVFAKHGWQPPWTRSAEDMDDDSLTFNEPLPMALPPESDPETLGDLPPAPPLARTAPSRSTSRRGRGAAGNGKRRR